MKSFLLLAVTIVGVSGAFAEEKKEDWRDSLTPAVGQPWLPMPEGRAVYHFGWSGFKAAEAELEFSRPKPSKKQPNQISQLEATGRTVGAARLVFRLDCHSLALADLTRFEPVRTRQHDKYSDREVISGLEFSPKNVIHSKSRREGDDIPRDLLVGKELDRDGMKKLTGKKGKRFKFPGLLDLQSTLLFLRAQPMRPGDEYRFVVFHESHPYYVRVKAGTPEKVKVQAGEFRAIPFTVELDWVDKKHRLRKHKNFRSATCWLSDDPARLLLKVESEVFVGKIWAELTSFTPAASGDAPR